MSFGSILYSILFEPLQIFFETVFYLANKLIGNQGLSIICLSIAMNLLVLPLYKRSDAMQDEERDIEKRLEAGVSHIKKTFKGDERMMMLQTYYRQNNYKPTYVLRGATSLFLQIPFFVAAYRFLSNLQSFNGASFGVIKDLSLPDGLIVIGSISINALPIIMTLVNFISSAIYTKDYPLKTKIQLYSVAIFFLIFLYKSPAGLVFYWTMNNVFSLLKTIVLKIFKKLKKHNKEESKLKNKAKKLIKTNSRSYHTQPSKKLYISACLVLTVFVGAVIPSAVIKSSPQEFVFTSCYLNPVWYVVSALCISFGTFVLWCGIFYWLASPKAKIMLEKVLCTFSGIAVANYMLFGTNLGNMSSTLKYDTGVSYDILTKVLNLLVVLIIAVIIINLINKFSKKISGVMIVVALAFCTMSVVNVVGINSTVKQIDLNNTDSNFEISLSKEQQNVVVIMLDRAMGEYVPYIMNENPELMEKYDGFTYYSNVTSFGGHTNFASPALFGGYEYTPVELNSRDDMSLMEKQNESLCVMPVLFDNNGFDVTVCNPSYANYSYTPDTSIYDEYESISAYSTGDTYLSDEKKLAIMDNNKRNFFMYSLMRSAPVAIQKNIYQDGRYCKNGATIYSINKYVSNGTSPSFLNAYSALSAMPSLTNTNSSKGCFLLMTNDTTHDVSLLQAPEYEPREHVDNTSYYEQNKDMFTVDGRTLKMDNYIDYSTYQSNVAALMKLADWLDYLRANDAYDNTRIIIVSDHGYNTGQLSELMATSSRFDFDAEYYFPLLLVKDFGSTGFCTSNEFMTNADVATIATNGVIDNPVNPFTGNLINSDEKLAHDQYIIMSENYSIYSNNGNTFMPDTWYSVNTSIWDKNNWTHISDDAVLTNDDIK